MRHSGGTGDSGAVLVLALAFFTVIAIGSTALLSLADTSLRTTVAVRDQGFELYSASGAVDAAVDAVRGDATAGRDALLGGTCPTTTTTLNGVATEVVCEGEPGSGAGGGGAVNSNNSPSNAILTLAGRTGPTAETGLLQRSSSVLTVTGPVVSTSTIEAPASGAVLAVTGPVRARGACTGTIVSTPVTDKACDIGTGAVTTSDGQKMQSADPVYPLMSGTPAAPQPPSTPPQGCATPAATFVVLYPGLYSSAAALNKLFDDCKGSVFWFRPGPYYFDFTDATEATSVWSITDPATHVIAGTPARWTPPAPGGPRPTVPFPSETDPFGGCVTSTESATAKGVQFAFGGSSRVFLEGARAELCATASSTQQQIALYGMTSASDTTSSTTAKTVSYAAGTATAAPSPGGFTNPDAAKAPGGAASEYVSTSTNAAGASVQLSSFTETTPLPAGATIEDVRLRVTHQPVDAGVTQLTATFVPGDGTAAVTVTDSTGTCASSTTTLCRTPSTALYNQLLELPASVRTPAALAGAKVTFAASVKATKDKGVETAGRQLLDSVLIEVTYRPASYRRLTGCATTKYAPAATPPTGCALLVTRGTKTALSVHGTVYAPAGAVDIELTGNGNQVLERGLIARTARIAVTASSSFVGSAVSLPPMSTTGLTPRRVVFTARQAGRDVLRARVKFEDGVSVGGSTSVLSWSVLR